MYKFIPPTAFMALLTIASAAPAADSGFYFGASIGQADSNFTSDIHQSLVEEGFSVVSLSLDNTDTGWKLFAGYAFNAYLAAEFSYVDLGQAGGDIVIGGRIPGRINTTMDMDGVNLGLKLNYPFDDQFSAFAKLGALLWNAKATANASLSVGVGTSSQKDSGTDLSYGLGLSYAFTTHVSIRGDWDRYRLGSDADADVNLWSVGVQYLF